MLKKFIKLIGVVIATMLNAVTVCLIGNIINDKIYGYKCKKMFIKDTEEISAIAMKTLNRMRARDGLYYGDELLDNAVLDKDVMDNFAIDMNAAIRRQRNTAKSLWYRFYGKSSISDIFWNLNTVILDLIFDFVDKIREFSEKST